jgi:hypothetical protein
MREEREIKAEITALRERVKELSGFWIGEGAAALYALEWSLGKHESSPARELGKTGGGYERIAANLTKLVEKAAQSKPSRPVAVAKSNSKPKPAKKANDQATRRRAGKS